MPCRGIALGLLGLLVFSNLAIAADPNDAPPKVKLIQPGQEPRRVLRHDTQQGALVMDAKASAGEWFANVDFPELRTATLQMNIEVNEQKVEAGQIKYDFTMLESKLANDEKLSETVRTAASEMIANCAGVSGEATVDGRGRVSSAKINMPEGLSHNSKQVLRSMEGSVESFCNPLPAEPVGVGAQWEVLTNVQSGGIPYNQVTRYTLTELTNDGYAAEVSVIRFLDRHALRMRGNTPGLRVELPSLKGVKSETARTVLKPLIPDSEVRVIAMYGMLASYEGPKTTVRIRSK